MIHEEINIIIIKSDDFDSIDISGFEIILLETF